MIVVSPDNKVVSPDNSGVMGNDAEQEAGSDRQGHRRNLDDGFIAYVVPKRKNGFEGRWLAMSQDAMLWLSRVAMGDLAKSGMGVGEFQVLMCLLGYVDYENHILTPQSEMAEKLGMDRSNFNRAVKRLVERGVIEKGPKIGRMVSLRLNPEYGWKGSAKNHVACLDQERKKRMAKAGIKGVIEGGQQAPERDPDTLDMFED